MYRPADVARLRLRGHRNPVALIGRRCARRS